MIKIEDKSGDLGILCNNRVYIEMVKWINENTILNGKEFVDQGYTVLMIPVMEEIQFGIRYGETPRSSVLKSLKKLIEYLKKADQVLIVN